MKRIPFRLLKKILRTNGAFKILDDLCYGSDWTHGGCMILAKSLKMLWPEAEILMVWDSLNQQPDHCVICKRGWVIDGERACRKETYLYEYTKDEFGQKSHKKVSLVSFNEKTCLEAGFATIYNATLVDYILTQYNMRIVA